MIKSYLATIVAFGIIHWPGFVPLSVSQKNWPKYFYGIVRLSQGPGYKILQPGFTTLSSVYPAPTGIRSKLS